jgi:hypothetical protein
MIAGLFQYYFMMADELPGFRAAIESVLGMAGFSVLSCGDESGLPQSLPFEPICWQFPALSDSCVLALALSPEGSLKEAMDYIWSLERQAKVDLDMILGQATVVISEGQNWEELLEQAAAAFGNKPHGEIAVKNGQLVRYALSPARALYIAQPGTYNAKTSNFWGQRLAQLEAQQLNTGLVSRLLRDQLAQVKREGSALERELSLILHANLVSARGAHKQAEELDAQLNTLTSSYGKIAGSRHLVTQGQSRLQYLVNQFGRLLRQESLLETVQPLYQSWMETYQERLDELAQVEANLQTAQQDYLAGIEVVRSRIDMMNNRSNLDTQAQIRALLEQNTEMQKQSLVFQYAAGLIEFIVLAYYSHSLWKNLAHDGYLLIPSWIQFVMVLLFSGNAVYCTHLLAEYMQGDHHVKSKAIAAVVVLLALLMVIITGTVMAGAPGTGAGAAAGH